MAETRSSVGLTPSGVTAVMLLGPALPLTPQPRGRSPLRAPGPAVPGRGRQLRHRLPQVLLVTIRS